MERTVSLRKAVAVCLILVVAMVGFAALAYVRSAYVGEQTEVWMTQPSCSYTYIIGPYNSTYFYAENFTGFGYADRLGYEMLGTSSQSIIQNALDNVTAVTQGGSIFIMTGTYSAAVTIKNATRVVIDFGAVGVTYSVAASAYCIIEDYQTGLSEWYSNGYLMFQNNAFNGATSTVYGTFNQLWAATFEINNGGVFPGAPTFTIYVVGSTYYGKAANGTVCWSSTNVSQVINNAIGNTSSSSSASGLVFIKDIQMPAQVALASNVIVEDLYQGEINMYQGGQAVVSAPDWTQDGLNLYLPMEQIAGNRVIDASAHGFDGTESGVSLTTGVVGNGLTFDSTTDYVSCSSGASPSVNTLGSVGSMATDGSWCWFAEPQAFYNDSITYYAYVTSAGVLTVAAYNQTAGTGTSSTIHAFSGVPNDHVEAAIIMQNDGKILVCWSAHAGSTMYYNISSNAEDITSWGTSGSFTSDASYSYPHLCLLSSGTIWLAYRSVGGSGDVRDVISYRKSTDGGATWSTNYTLVGGSTGVGYFKMTTDGTKIYFAIDPSAPTYLNSYLDFCYYDSSDSNFKKMDGTIIKAEGALPMTESDLERLSSSNCWIWDIAVHSGIPYIVYVYYPSYSVHDYEYMYWSGSAWVNKFITANGYLNLPSTAFDLQAAEYYSGGITLDNADCSIVYLSKQAGSSFEVFKYQTADGGSTWTATQLTTDSSSILLNMRPVNVLNHGSVVKVLWMYGVYSSYQAFDTAVVSYPSVSLATATLYDNNFTVSSWVYPISDTSSGSYNAHIVREGNEFFLLMQHSTRYAWFQVKSTTAGVFSSVAYSKAALGLYQWTLVTATYNGQLLSIYINGTLNAVYPQVGAFTADGTAVMVGAKLTTTDANDFNGTLDEVRLYNRALSANEVEGLYYSQALTKGLNETLTAKSYTNSGQAVNGTATTFTISDGLAGTISYGHGGFWCSFNSSQISSWKWSCSGTTITVTVVNSATTDQIIACYWTAKYAP